MLRSIVVVMAFLSASVIARRTKGTAFPIDSENYAIDEFQTVNKNIKWDYTNFLIDLAGTYAACENMARQGAFLAVDEKTEEGKSITAYFDVTEGGALDGPSLNTYAQTIIDRWVKAFDQEIYNQISVSKVFGCSIRPNCNGRTLIACLFTDPIRGGESGTQHSVAFTEEQYEKASETLGKDWNYDHFLEDLSGYETTCSLIHERDHQYSYALNTAKRRGRDVKFFYGHSPNKGETEPAMMEVLRGIQRPQNAKKVGCSLIPDCMDGEQMIVVVGCLFEMDKIGN